MRFFNAIWPILLGVVPANADTRALLIGVSHYDESIGIPSLRGPANDVRLLRDTLANRGVTDITILADGVEGGTRPTHAAILAAFAGLAASSGSGDLIFVSMSGHGTRQPDENGDETDGLDEVFLPADTGRAESGARTIPNALVDDEIGAAVYAIRQTGADVFLAMDSCHSGSGLRAGSPDSAARYVDPAILGVMGAEASAAAAVSAMDVGADDPPGGVTAFYAARSSEVAREVNLTPGAGDDAGWYGLFSQRLAARISNSDGQSYRQLFQGVLSDLNDTSLPGGGPLQTPSWEGNLIDAAVFGGRATLGVRQFAVTGDQIAAGLVQGFGKGSLFALVADAAAPVDAVLGFAQIEEVEATRGYLRPVEAGCEPRSEAPCPSMGALPRNARFARLEARPVDVALRLASLRDLATGQPVAPGDPAAMVLAAAVAEVNAAGGMRVEMDAGRSDIEVAVEDGALWFGRRVAIGATPVGLKWQEGGQPLVSLLERIGAAQRLATLLDAVAEGGSILNPSPVSVQTDVQASRMADLDPPGLGGNPMRECRRAAGAAGVPEPLDLAEAPAFKQCDQLAFLVKGEVQGARDVNRVHIDSQFCVHAAHTRIEDATAAAALGAPMVMCSDCPDGYAAGDERLFVIVTEAEPNSDQLNLEGLIENCGSAGAPTRSAGDRAALDFLTALGHRPETRGAFGGLALSNVWVSSYRWQIIPKDELFSRVKSTESRVTAPLSGP